MHSNYTNTGMHAHTHTCACLGSDGASLNQALLMCYNNTILVRLSACANGYCTILFCCHGDVMTTLFPPEWDISPTTKAAGGLVAGSHQRGGRVERQARLYDCIDG